MRDIDEPEFFDDDDDYGNGREVSDEELAEFIASKEDKRCSPVPYNFKDIRKEIGVIDTETDPFEHGVDVKPFALGVELSDRYLDFIGDDCVIQFFQWLEAETAAGREFIFYAHNGGKFDFYFLLDYLDEDQTPLIMGGRLVKIYFQRQEFRDSFAIIPESLESANTKTKIDYNKFRREVRAQHMTEIRAYLRDDCRYLYQLVTAFLNRFGDCLTVASAALRTLRSYHGFEQFTSDQMDERFRRYYFGGRNQCFETGILKARPGKRWRIVDRNSMYPAEMMNSRHPISNRVSLQTEIDENTDFACIIAINRGALPSRAENGSLDFTVERGEFYATIHEILAGIETGTLEIIRVKHAWAFDKKATFGEFVTDYYGRRMVEKEAGENIEEKNTKRIMNSSYGKFALNPRKFKQWMMTRGEFPEPRATAANPAGWSLHSQAGDLFIFSRPSPRRNGFYNVATAASITGAARANLLRAISHSVRPIYCDTDSVICEEFNWADQMGNALGQWKLEGEGDTCAIAGKKLYAVFEGDDCIKKASKGVRLDAHEIMSVCNGDEILYKNEAPTFKLGPHKDGLNSSDTYHSVFIDRTIKMTGRKAA